MQQLTSVDEVRIRLSDCDIVYDSGFAVPVTCVTLADVPAITTAVVLHTTLLPVKAELDQLAEGLHLFGVLSLLRQYPVVMQPLFMQQDSQLTITQMVGSLDIEYSPHSTSKRVLEEATFMHFDEFINDIGNGMIGKKFMNNY